MNHSNFSVLLAPPSNNFARVNFGDQRLSDRFLQVVQKLELDPASSFPAVFTQEKKLDAFYRFVNNPRVMPNGIAENIYQNTTAAFSNYRGKCLAIHDTTEFSYRALEDCPKAGPTGGSDKGFFGHFCIAVGFTERLILGVLGLKTWSRTDKNPGSKGKGRKKSDPHNEGLRWDHMVNEVTQRLPEGSQVIHVMDREGDDYTRLSKLSAQNSRFVIRVQHDRKTTEGEWMGSVLNRAQIQCEREVPIRSRTYKNKNGIPPKQMTRHPERQHRLANLGIYAQKINICKPKSILVSQASKQLLLNFVRVFEIDPPEGEKKIEWTLVTSEAIETDEDVLEIVDIYRTRWVIEEYFKAIKTGCAMEKRGFESTEALINCLWIFAPMAAQLYNMKIMSRKAPKESSEKLFTTPQIKILAHLTSQPPQQIGTIADAYKAIAALGGHLKRNGPPGWQVLFRGYQKLLDLEKGLELARFITLQ